MKTPLQKIKDLGHFTVKEDLSGVYIEPGMRHIRGISLIPSLIFFLLISVPQVDFSTATPTLLVILYAVLALWSFWMAIIIGYISLGTIFPDSIGASFRQNIHLTCTTITLPGWLLAPQETISLESITDVRQIDIWPFHPDSLFLQRPSGRGIEIETVDGTFMFTFNMNRTHQSLLIPLIQQAVYDRRQKLLTEGHDLTERPSVPADLAKLRQR